jgi:hypothetical protein
MIAQNLDGRPGYRAATASSCPEKAKTIVKMLLRQKMQISLSRVLEPGFRTSELKHAVQGHESPDRRRIRVDRAIDSAINGADCRSPVLRAAPDGVAEVS